MLLRSAPSPARSGRAAAPAATRLAGWGGGRAVAARVVRPQSTEALAALLAAPCSRGEGAIARGRGRSYGDAAQLTDGLAIDMTGLAGHTLDAARGTVTAGAGMTVGELLDAVVPSGWLVPVVPGTQHVTLGGAVASDIHGKNHGTAGTFGAHVEALGLLTAAGEELELRAGDPDARFEATVGGMGLTGIVTWVRLRLRRAAGAWLAVDTDRIDTLDEALAALRAPGGPHRVAWLDLLGRRVRGVVTRASELEVARPLGTARTASPTVSGRARVPAAWPGTLLRPEAVRAHNELRYRLAPRRERGRPEPFGGHMFPLDALDGWPHLYGARGFVQYQVAVPARRADVLEVIIERLRRAGVPCYLAVLKDFGPEGDGLISFPIEGWTLALDLPRGPAALESTLDDLDDLVAAAGGRVYLTKDARLRPESVAAMYPRLDRFRAVRDSLDPERRWRSDLALRTGLVER